VSRIYLSAPDVGVLERKRLLEALDSGWVAPVGPDLDAFEREVAERAGVPHAVALSSGTAALHLAMLELGVTAGDDVLLPTLTFVASANVIRYVGARPVLLDVDGRSWQLDAGLVAEELRVRARLGRRPAAVVAVDLYGQTPDYDALEAVCREYEVALVEDAAEALGATYGGRRAGSFGAAGVFSFNGNKIVTTSGGGMLVSSSKALVERARHLATQARQPVVHYEHLETGFNYRMSNLLAALGRAQLDRLDAFIARRLEIRNFYEEALSALPGVCFMPRPQHGEANFWLTCILVDPREFGAGREAIRLALEAHDIESRPVWKPLHLQPAYRDAETVGGGVAAGIFETGLCLPSGSGLNDSDLERVVSVVTALAGDVRGHGR